MKIDTELTTKELNAYKKQMIDHGSYPVSLRGSGKDVNRNVYEDENGRCYIVWYKQLIEVIRGRWGYETIEAY